MAELSDLVKRLQLNTKVDESAQIITHLKYRSDPGTGRRRVRHEERWKRERFLAQGSMGTVWLERRIGSPLEVRAVKRVQKRPDKHVVLDAHEEAVAMAILSHPENEGLFVAFYGWFETNDSLCLVMEYIEQGDLDTYLHKHHTLPESEAASVCRQTLEGLKVIHEANYIHRDLKPGNILIQRISPWWVKISDFGISRRVTNSVAITLTGAGSTGYKAPEIKFNERSPHTNAVDLWSLGCVGHKILTGRIPFADSRALELFVRDSTSFSQEVEALASISQECRAFLQSLIVVDPSVRATTAEAMASMWILSSESAEATDSHEETTDFTVNAEESHSEAENSTPRPDALLDSMTNTSPSPNVTQDSDPALDLTDSPTYTATATYIEPTEATKSSQLLTPDLEPEPPSFNTHQGPHQSDSTATNPMEPTQLITPQTLFNLRHLIQTRHDLDIKIWRLRNTPLDHRRPVLDKMQKADAILHQIREIISGWREGDWTPAEWAMAREIKERIGLEGKRSWMENPPWDDS